jgi:hypothetical protein
MDFKEEHAIETFKSLINISLAGLKLLALLNGGAAVALLAFIGNVSGKGLSIPDMRLPMGFFLGGLVFCGIAFLLSYLTQYFLYQEIRGIKTTSHVVFLIFAFTFSFLSLAAFASGSLLAMWKFQNPCPGTIIPIN